MKRLTAFGITFYLLAQPCSAHPGRTDSCGGHTMRKDYTHMDSRGVTVSFKKGDYHFHHIPYTTEAEFKQHLRPPVGPDSVVMLECTTPDGRSHVGPLLKRSDHGLGSGEATPGDPGADDATP